MTFNGEECFIGIKFNKELELLGRYQRKEFNLKMPNLMRNCV